MREKTIESKLVKAVKNMGGLAPKFVSPGFDGVPDRIVFLPHGKIAFVELKAKGRTAEIHSVDGGPVHHPYSSTSKPMRSIARIIFKSDENSMRNNFWRMTAA